MLTEDLKKKEAIRKARDTEKDRKKMEEVLPKFEAGLKILQEKHQVVIEAFILPDVSRGIIPSIRIRNIQKADPSKSGYKPYDVK